MKYTNAELILDGQHIPIPLTSGSDGSQALDMEDLREKTGLFSFDPSLHNTAITRSSITWINSKYGMLLYRGYNVEELVSHSTFVETSYLLTYGELPNEAQLKEYSSNLTRQSMIHEDMRKLISALPKGANPMAILATMISALASFYPNTYEDNLSKGIDITTGLLSKVRTLAAWAHKKSIGQPVVYPRHNLPYAKNFLNMMFSMPPEPYLVKDEDEKILNQILILYSDHEQNVSTATVRLVGSTRSNLFACISAGIAALWGIREAGANIPPIPMLEMMANHSISPENYFDKFIKGREPLRSNGLGHSSYITRDPRAVISQKLFHAYVDSHPHFKNDPIIMKAFEMEQFTNGHPFFIEKGLYPNLDFYSALIFRMLGIPPQMNNVIRVIGKLAGWIAHWHEQREEQFRMTYRPNQLYSGKLERKYTPLQNR